MTKHTQPCPQLVTLKMSSLLGSEQSQKRDLGPGLSPAFLLFFSTSCYFCVGPFYLLCPALGMLFPGSFAEMDLSSLLAVNKRITSLGGLLSPCSEQVPLGQHPIPHLAYFLIAFSQSEIIFSLVHFLKEH